MWSASRHERTSRGSRRDWNLARQSSNDCSHGRISQARPGAGGVCEIAATGARLQTVPIPPILSAASDVAKTAREFRWCCLSNRCDGLRPATLFRCATRWAMDRDRPEFSVLDLPESWMVIRLAIRFAQTKFCHPLVVSSRWLVRIAASSPDPNRCVTALRPVARRLCTARLLRRRSGLRATHQGPPEESAWR